ncbi:MAG TPA: hypothetical protein VHZ74_11815 [Bryobacteraceae bacterium]|nr:hypothetical protein [Bryobacteraceae bacterium]
MGRPLVAYLIAYLVSRPGDKFPIEPRRKVRFLERVALGTPYTGVVARV